MKRQFVALLVLIIILSSGCSTKASKPAIFTVYCSLTHEGVVEEFKKANPNIDIAFYDPTGGDENMSEEDALLRLRADMMAGQGPDVIITYGNEINSKLLDSGMILDLNDLIEKDPSFNFSEYNQGVLDAGIYRGKRLILPIRYVPCLMYTTQTKLQQNNIMTDFEDGLSLLEAFEAVADKGTFRIGTNRFMFERLSLTCWDEELIDYDTQTLNLKSKTFRRTMELLRYDREMQNLLPDIYPYQIDAYKTIVDKEYAFFHVDSLIDYQIRAQMAFQTDQDGKMILPRNNEGGLTAMVISSGLINANTKQLELSWEFLKFALSSDFQKSYYIGGVPVLDSAVNDRLEYHRGRFSGGRYSDEMYLQYVEAVGSVNKAYIVYQLVDWKKLYELFEPYISGELSFEETAARAENYFSIYFSE